MGVAEETLRPNDEAMWRFVTWWFRDCTQGLIEIGWTVPGEDRGIRRFKRFALEDEGLVEFCCQQNLLGSNLYQRVATIAPDAPLGRVTDLYVVEIPGAWGDWDTQAHLESAKKVVHLVQANALVITGRVPHMRAQPFLKYRNVLVDRERSRSVNAGLAQLWQSDSSVVNPSRLMRLPGSIAWPVKPGRVAELTEFHILGNRPECYDVEFIEQQVRGVRGDGATAPGDAAPEDAASADDWGPSPAETVPNEAGTSSSAISPETELLRKIRAGDQWHNNVLRLVAHLVGSGLSDAMILAMAEGLTLPGWAVAQTAAELRVMIEGARRRWMRSDPRPAVLVPPSEDDVEPIDIFSGYDQPAPVLKPEHVPGPIYRFAIDTGGRLGVDPAAVALGCLVTCAAVMSDRWRLQPKLYDKTWIECARLWGGIVGDPSILKSPVVRLTTEPVDRLEASGRDEHRERLKEYEERLIEWKKSSAKEGEPEKPRQPRYLVESTTKEALEDVLREDGALGLYAPCDKLLCRQDELNEFVVNQDRYTQGKGSDRGAWLRAYNGGRYVIDRVGRGHFAVRNWSVCLLGGIQPDAIREIATRSTDDGLLQRFMFIVPWGEPAEGLDRAPNEAVLEAYEGLIPRLSRMLPRTGLSGRDSVVVIHKDGHRHRLGIDHLVRLLRLQRAGSPRMLSAMGKWSGLFGRLCLTFHLIELAAGSGQYPDVVGEATAGMVASFMREVLLPHLFRADEVIFSTPRSNEVRWIAEHILAHRLERLSWRMIVQANKGWRAPEARQGLEAALGGLVACGWLEPEASLPGRQPHAWTVNPRVHIVFAEKAEQARAAREAVREAIQKGERGREERGD